MENFINIKFICLLFLLCVASMSARALQTDDVSIALPKAEDVEKIETTKGEFRFQTPESLLRKLPNMIAVTPGNLKVSGYQYGTIRLTDGRILKWRSSSYGNVYLSDGKSEQLYVEDESFWSYFLSKFVYDLALLILFTVFLGNFIFQRNQPGSDFAGVSGFFSRDSLKITGVRMLAFLLFACLAYLLLQVPAQELNDGVIHFYPKGAGKVQYIFADTEPNTFRFSVFINSIFGLLAIFFGIIFLSLNPKSKFWRRKPKTTNQSF